MALLLKVSPEFSVVVDLTVEHCPDCAVFSRYGLMAPRDIDNG